MKVRLANQDIHLTMCPSCYRNEAVEDFTGQHGSVHDSKGETDCAYCGVREGKEAGPDMEDLPLKEETGTYSITCDHCGTFNERPAADHEAGDEWACGVCGTDLGFETEDEVDHED